MNTPNILFICVDQQRLDCIGKNGKYGVKTPNIDSIANDGIWFNNAFTPIPLCCPAREALINGRRPETFGSLWNYGIIQNIGALDPKEYAWPRDLKAEGYQNAYVGKWHVNPQHTPLDYGYDEYIGVGKYEKFRSESYPKVQFINGWFGEKNPIPVEDSRTHFLAREAICFMEQYSSGDKPWHIRLDFEEPHLPCRPSGKFAQMYKKEEIQKWTAFGDKLNNKPYMQKQQLLNWGVDNMSWEEWSETVALYYGIISQVDDAIGIVLEALRVQKQDKNTIIIFTSDHGDMCGSRGMMDKHYVMYDELVRVPLAIKWPEKIKPNTKSDAFVLNCLDLVPTILDMCGLKKYDFLQGESLLPCFDGSTPGDWRTQVMSTYNGQQFGLYTQRMLRDKNWKYVWNASDMDELYDLINDPDELINLINEKQYYDIIADMRKRLYAELKKAGDGLVKGNRIDNQLLFNKKLVD